MPVSADEGVIFDERALSFQTALPPDSTPPSAVDRLGKTSDAATVARPARRGLSLFKIKGLVDIKGSDGVQYISPTWPTRQPDQWVFDQTAAQRVRPPL
jgi:hypothetical protein